MSGKAKNGKSAADYADRLVARNRRASFDYELGQSYEAGLSLIGSEARALREQTADLTDAWVDIQSGQAWVKGLRIPTLHHAAFAHEEKRPRKLLLHRAELEKLTIALERDRMTLVATKLYFKTGRAKLEICVAKGKKTHDKRQSLRDRDAAKEARDAIRQSKGR
jgi:SsrA-binding protein